MSRFRLRLRGLRSDQGGGADRHPESSGKVSGVVEPVVERATPGKVAGCGSLVFGIFLLVGLIFLAVFAVPAVRVVQARGWDSVQCEILQSSVARHSDSDGTTFSIEVTYSYRVGGRSFTGERYGFMDGSSSGSTSKRRVVDALAPGTVTTCWVNPEDPADAVLDRSPPWTLLFGLLPLLFVIVGAGGIVVSLRAGWKLRFQDAAGKPRWMPDRPGASPERRAPSAAPAPIGPGSDPSSSYGATAASFSVAGPSGTPDSLELEPTFSPVGKLTGIVAICLIWNGVVSVFLWQLWQSWQDGQLEGCLALFLIPFVLIGLVLLLGVPYQILALFNPRPRLTVTPGRLVLGGRVELRWSFTGATRRIRRLQITLEGREEADYTRGTDRHTDKEVFATHDVVDTSAASQIATGSAPLRVPVETMHSFEAPDNRILWHLKLHGTIRMWPDVIEELPVVIEPLPLEEIREVEAPEAEW